MNYVLILVIYSILTPGIYMKKEIKTWPLTSDTCQRLAKKAMADPELNKPTSYLMTAKCIPVKKQPEVFPQDEIQLPKARQLNM